MEKILNIRPAEQKDVCVMVEMIRELGDFEKCLDQVYVTEELLTKSLFSEQSAVFAHVAELIDSEDSEDSLESSKGEVVGMTIWFLNYSTWLGKHGIYLEDLYVRPQHRGKGYGTALLNNLMRICVERDYGRLEWSVLDWNEQAIKVYKKIGAQPMDEWTTYRLSGEILSKTFLIK